jgi:hypothetical protein
MRPPARSDSNRSAYHSSTHGVSDGAANQRTQLPAHIASNNRRAHGVAAVHTSQALQGHARHLLLCRAGEVPSVRLVHRRGLCQRKMRLVSEGVPTYSNPHDAADYSPSHKHLWVPFSTRRVDDIELR